jgi:hypothetical protein
LVASFGVLSGARGCPMDKDNQLKWEMSEDVLSVLALMACISLWGFLTTAATIYSATFGY